MDYLEEAKQQESLIEDAPSYNRSNMYASRAIATALIAIAEQLIETNKRLAKLAQAFDQDSQAIRTSTWHLPT